MINAPPEIIRGLYQAIANRIEGMVRRVGLVTPTAITGGGALNCGLVHTLEKRLQIPISSPENPQPVGAIGAAFLGMERKEGESVP